MSDLDQLLRRADPIAQDDADSFDLTHGFDDAFAGIVAADPEQPRAVEPTRRRRSRRALLSVGLAATLVVGGATAAAAGWSSVHTGFFGHRGDTENDASEFLNVSADAMPRVAAQLGKDIPFPPGDDASAYIPGLVRGGGLMQADGIRSYLTSDSLCAWWGYWLQSHDAGNAAEQARATAVLDAAPGWPIVVKSDGGGTVDLYNRIAAAAHAGEPALLQSAVRANCTTLPRRWAHK